MDMTSKSLAMTYPDVWPWKWYIWNSMVGYISLASIILIPSCPGLPTIVSPHGQDTGLGDILRFAGCQYSSATYLYYKKYISCTKSSECFMPLHLAPAEPRIESDDKRLLVTVLLVFWIFKITDTLSLTGIGHLHKYQPLYLLWYQKWNILHTLYGRIVIDSYTVELLYTNV